MDRLTKRDFESDFCKECPDYGEPNGCNRSTGSCDAQEFCSEAWDKLAAYEDMGLTPKEVAKLKTNVVDYRKDMEYQTELLQKAKAEVERLRAEVNSYNTTLGETISECAANMQEKEQENKRLRLYVKSITGGLNEAIEAIHYLETEIAKLRKVVEAAREYKTAFDTVVANPNKHGMAHYSLMDNMARAETLLFEALDE